MKIITTNTSESLTTTIDYEAVGSRQCGGCTLCCKLLPNMALQKRSGVPCRHQQHGKGCRIYNKRPMECEAWVCRWLGDKEETDGMPRPDRAHYVIDVLLDTIQIMTQSETKDVSALQIWIDPSFPKTALDPKLRDYMFKMADQYGLVTLLRWSSSKATAVFPPPLCLDKKWHEQDTNCDPSIGMYSQLPPSLRPPI